MLQPLELLALARQLAMSQEEVNLRSAANRAYYGGFHFAGERLEQLTAGASRPFDWTGARKSHQLLRAHWRNQRDGTGHAIANFLFAAHELRKKADYDLDLVFTPEDLANTFRVTEGVVQTAQGAG